MTLSVPTAYFITHPDVLIDPAIPVPEWPLSQRGRERMTRIIMLPWVGGIRAIWCSSERKARDAADILADHLGLPVAELADLGENDRSATGYLPKAEFEAMAELFFAEPEQSINGWERAVDAQRRIVTAVDDVLAATVHVGGDVAIVAHGGVGTLLLCHLRRDPISRKFDQPPSNGGNYFAFEIGSESSTMAGDRSTNEPVSKAGTVGINVISNETRIGIGMSLTVQLIPWLAGRWCEAMEFSAVRAQFCRAGMQTHD